MRSKAGAPYEKVQVVRTIEETIAENIVARLHALKMDQSELAKLSGLTRQTINRIINGQVKSIRRETRLAIASALLMKVSELEQDQSLVNANNAVIGLLHDRIEELEADLNSIPPDIREALIDLDNDSSDWGLIRSILGLKDPSESASEGQGSA